jgi:hypothetical protein
MHPVARISIKYWKNLRTQQLCCVQKFFQYLMDTCISNIDNTPATKKRQAITGVRQKASTAHSSDHHDADRLAGHKTWRIAQKTTTRIYF